VDDGSRNDRGFTLIKLMVVVLVIAILLAIAIPVFLGSKTSSNDRAAQSNLSTMLSTAVSTGDDIRLATHTALATEAGSLTTVDGLTPSTGPSVISVGSTSTAWLGAVQSKTGSCWYVVRTTTGQTSYAGETSGACTAGRGASAVAAQLIADPNAAKSYPKAVPPGGGFSATLTPPAGSGLPAPVASWSLSGPGPTVANNQPGQPSGSVFGGATFTAVGPSGPGGPAALFAPQEFGGWWAFGGVDSSGDIALRSGSKTYEHWFRKTSSDKRSSGGTRTTATRTASSPGSAPWAF
jgi:type IV pilus assembly protein PilA